jgi:integrase/recombinase XerD
MEESFINKQDVIIIDPKKNLTFRAESVKRENAKYLKKDEINFKINQIQNPEHRMLCVFLWMSGVRITEAITLKKKDIDFTEEMMSVKWQKSKKYKKRIVPIHRNLLQMLRIYTASKNLEDLVFPISRQRAFQITKKHMNISPHQLRHSFAVNWLICKGDIVTLHRILGHANIKTTMEYLKIIPTDQKQELEKIIF